MGGTYLSVGDESVHKMGFGLGEKLAGLHGMMDEKGREVADEKKE